MSFDSLKNRQVEDQNVFKSNKILKFKLQKNKLEVEVKIQDQKNPYNFPFEKKYIYQYILNFDFSKN